MGCVKRFAEEVSVLMGYEGEINDFVLEVAQSMFSQSHKLVQGDNNVRCRSELHSSDTPVEDTTHGP